MVWSATDNVSLFSSLNRPGNPEVVTADSLRACLSDCRNFRGKLSGY